VTAEVRQLPDFMRAEYVRMGKAARQQGRALQIFCRKSGPIGQLVRDKYNIKQREIEVYVS